MNLSRLNIVLAVILGGVLIAIASAGSDRSKPNYEFLPDMKYSPASSAYEPNSNFPNDRTLQSPVEGTIAQGPLPFHYKATKEDAIRAGEELTDNPFKTKEKDAKKTLLASVQRGGEQFRIFCVSCHGASGIGDGPVPKRGFPPPPSLLTGKSVAMKDGQLFHILTYGQGSMASFAPQLTPDQRWDVINFVRSLQAATPPAAPTTPSPSSPDTPSSDASDDKATSQP